jgi:DNA-binding transcriptional LysR family regulator
MNLHQLNVFKAIVETGSFSRAALQLHIAQSAVSYHVKALEAEIGEPLFLRVKTKVFLTEKGRRLRDHVEIIFQAVVEAQVDLCARARTPGDELHFGLGVSSLSDQLPDFIRHVKALCPEVCFRVVMGSTPQVLELLRAKSVDLGIVSLPVQDTDIAIQPLFYEEEDMLVVISKTSPLATHQELRPDDLRELPLILYNRTTATRANLDNFFRQSAITPLVFMEVDREDTIMTLVRSGLGATILPRCVLSGRQDDDSLRFLRLRNAYLRRDVGVALLKDGRHLPLVDTAIELCVQHFHASHCAPEVMVTSSR